MLPAEQDLALDAVQALVADGLDVRLTLLGGAESSAALKQWQNAAALRNLTNRLRITGPVSADAASAELARSDVYLHLDSAGPTSRKSSLAAALAIGVPAVANEGSQTWQMFRDSGAVEIVEATGLALATSLSRLLHDDASRSSLGERGRRFYQDRLALDKALDAYVPIIGAVTAN